MDLVWLIDAVGEAEALALCGLLVGLVFGVAAQRSRFCLRAATVEFARGRIGPKVSVWLLTFATALAWTQGLGLSGEVDLYQARYLAVAGSMSGAIVGGLIFGVGMVLARGCAGRLLVLAATGNMRAVVSGLVFAVVAQMSLRGVFAPARETIARAWATPGGENVQIIDALGLPAWTGMAIGLAFVAIALWAAARNRVGAKILFMASGVGFTVALGWWLTYTLSLSSFDPVTVKSVTFTGPSADTLMWTLSQDAPFDFDLGLIVGVFAGALGAAFWAGEAKWQGFDGAAAMRRYLAGAAMMGFGGMLAGGCAIGAGVTGGSVFALTAWVALTAMWAGAMATDRVLDQPVERPSHA